MTKQDTKNIAKIYIGGPSRECLNNEKPVQQKLRQNDGAKLEVARNMADKNVWRKLNHQDVRLIFTS